MSAPASDRIDLHAHTRHSDGSLEPRDLVRLAADSGLRALAVTDHDTTAGFEEARQAGASLGVEVLCGAEVTAKFPGRAMHLLAYGFDRHDARLREMFRGIVASREERNPKILALLAGLGVPVSEAEMRAAAGGLVVGRPHIAKAMVSKGYVPDAKTAFALWLRDGGPAFVPAESVEPAEAIAVVRAAGGAVVLAHPKQLRVEGLVASESLVRDLRAAGLAGIEVFHPSHDADQRAFWGGIAERAGLVSSGGSDFHGETKPDVRLGVGRGDVDVRYATWEAIKARCPAWVR